MQVCIHRGTKEIGGSCVEIISLGKRIIIDLGLPLDADKNDKKYLPDVKGLDGRDSSLLAILISHAHMDHFGLLAHISGNIPVIMGEAARRILTSASPFLPGTWPVPADGPSFHSGIPIDLRPFRITPYLVDHSAYDAYSILIESENQRLFYSGDLRIHGRKAGIMNKLSNALPGDIDVLLLEGSTLNRSDNSPAFMTEQEIENKLESLFKSSKALVMVHTSSQNIDRIVSIFRACKKSGRKLIIDLYTAVILEATGKKNIPQSCWPEVVLYIPQSQRIQIKNNKWFDLLKRHSANRIFPEKLCEISANSVLLFRPLHIRDLEKAGVLKDAEYIYSQWEGYWETDSNEFLRSWLAKHNIQKKSIHTSGHADMSELKHFAETLSPARIVPIHTFVPENYNYLFNNAEIHNDGETWEV